MIFVRRLALCFGPALLLLGMLVPATVSHAAPAHQGNACVNAGTPTNAVVRYYLAIDRGQFAAAYRCLSPSLQHSTPYGHWVAGYAHTKATRLLLADELTGSNGRPSGTVIVNLLGVDSVNGKLTATTFHGSWSVNTSNVLTGAQIQVESRRTVNRVPTTQVSAILTQAQRQTLQHLRASVTGDNTLSDIYITSMVGCASCHAQQVWVYNSGRLIFQQEVDDAQITPAGNHAGMTIATDTPGSPGLDSCCPTEKTIATWAWTRYGFALRGQRLQLTPFGRRMPTVRDPMIIRQHGYDPVLTSQHTHDGPVHTPDGFGHTLYAWVAVCHGSGDGYCQKVFFFVGTHFIGTDTKTPSPAIIRLAARGAGTIAVTYANYLKNDPMCCPTGKPFTDLYHWNGHQIVRSRSDLRGAFNVQRSAYTGT